MSLKGKKQMEEHRKKIGISVSLATKGRIPWNKGKTGIFKHTDEWKKLNSERMKGEKHHAWQGGITPLNLSIRACFEYRQWRSDVFTKDNFTCVLCGDCKGGNLNADHIKPFARILKENNIQTIEQALNCQELWNINNGRTLCIPCHRKTDTFGGYTRNKII